MFYIHILGYNIDTKQFDFYLLKGVIPMGTSELTVADTQGNIVNLEDFKGEKLVLFFYPKANSSGCTNEVLAFKELYDEFRKLGVAVLGISKDSVKAQKNFKEKYDLPFELLSDVEAKVCESYQVLKEKSMYGKKYIGIERSTFVIDENLNIIKEYRNVKVKGHAEDVLEFLSQMQGQ